MELRQACLCIFVAAMVLSACGHRNAGLPPPLNQGQFVAVYGDSESELAADIQAATAAGKNPVYVTLTAPNKSYVFPVYAQILRSQGSIIVVAYNHIYSYKPDVHITYGSDPVASSSIPLVKAPTIDWRAAQAQPGQFLLGPTKQKARLCPDCLMLILSKRSAAGIASRWASVQDPWQTNPAYVAWQPDSPTAVPSVMSVSQLLRPQLVILPNPPDSCGILNSACTGCYSMFGAERSSFYCEQGGGSSLIGGPTPQPTPAPDPCAGYLSLSVARHSESARSIQLQTDGPAISDNEIDQHIDPALPASDRVVMHDVLRALRPSDRYNVAYFASDRNYASSHAVLEKMQRWTNVRDNLYKKPDGEVAVGPPFDLRDYPIDKNPAPIGGIHPFGFGPPSGPGETGAIRRVYTDPGYNWIWSSVYLPCDAASGYKIIASGSSPPPDNGYIYEAGYGMTGSDEFEIGFQYSTKNNNYVLYGKDYFLHPGQLNSFGSIPCGQTVSLSVYVTNLSQVFTAAVGRVVSFPGGADILPVMVIPVPFYDWPVSAFGDRMARLTTIAQDPTDYNDGSAFGFGFESTPSIDWDSDIGVFCGGYIAGWPAGSGGTLDSPEDSTKMFIAPEAARFFGQEEERDAIYLHP